MKSFLKKELLLFLIIFSPFILAQNKGHLVIIGGGVKPDNIVEKFVEFAGGENAKIMIIPNATSEKLKSYEYTKREFNKAGCYNIYYLFCNTDQANADSNVQKLNDITGVFFLGGDQSRLTNDLLGTKLFAKIKEIYKNGGVVGGTSAGAAVMSKVMITGNELLNEDSSTAYNSIKKNNIETVEGFGFINSAIIDQHFIKRKRLNRLISTVLDHPKLIGIGIDESTSIIVNPNKTFEVLGESQVIIFDATKSKNIKVNNNDNLGVQNLKVNILISGDKYDLKNREVIK